MSEPITLLAPGVLFKIELMVGEQDFDWLDETILDVTAKPQRIGELLDCFDLPERLLQDAIARLIERHSLLLDVAAGTVRRSTIPAGFHASTSRPEDVWVWQDYATGTMLPWEHVKAWCGAANDRERTLSLRGGPPARTVLEMSDAELQSQLERYRSDAVWSERIRRKEHVRVEGLHVRARLLDDGRVLPEDEGIPWILALRWQRLAQIAEGPRRVAADVLPKGWSELIGQWAQRAHERIEALRRGAPLAADTDCSHAIREALERSPFAEHQLAGGLAVERVRTARRMSVAVIAERPNGFGGAVSILRQTSDGVGRQLLLPAGAKLNVNQNERAKNAGVEIGHHPRTDQEFLLLDANRILFGACEVERRRVISVSWRRPLLAHAAWLADCGMMRGDDELLRDPDDVDHLITRIAEFEEMLGELERTPRPPRVDNEQKESAAGDRLAWIERDRIELQDALIEKGPTPSKLVAAEYLVDVFGEWKGSVRIIVRDPRSPLVDLAKRLNPEQLEGLVVWSLTRPDPSHGCRWLEEPGACDIVILGNIVLLGCWTDTGVDNVPPFIALHAEELAAAVRQATKNATRID